ncbi:PAS domain S-box-containing protein [Aquabacterium commune]|uniref:histidine kinase n=1 Tax=Aquabacterium commune TaxID=70586 RepID=A0A4R6R824_9BURK|nr:ATP-binding protein [Aquabacterium commune]TDP82052.1 PAS domain S-box-containing protein [Aquabacterium commune]
MNIRSLRVFLPLALLALMLLTGAVSVVLSLQQQQRHLTEEARLSVLADVSRLVRLTSEGMGSTSSLVAAEVAQIASRPQVHRVLLLDERGTVLNAQRAAWRGRSLKEVAPELVGERLQQATHSRMPQWHMQPDGSRMDAVQSFELPLQNDELRSSRRGLVYVAYDLREQRAAATRSEVQARLPELAGLLAVFLLMAWWLGRHVTQPLARLDAAAKALRASDLSVPVPRGGFLEIDQLAGGLEALRQELSATWHAIPDLLFELDARGRYLRVLAVRPELVVQAPQSLLGRTVHEVMPADAAQAIQQALDDAAVSGAVWGREFALQVPAGQRWFEVSVARKTAPDHGSPTFLLISRDITERKEATVSLQQLNEALEQRVQSRTAELLGAKNEAERANDSKSEFLSRMSHELRTPLNAILGFGQLLELSAQEPKQQRQVGHILSAGKHLLSLINEILDLSRVESGQMTLSLEPVPVAELVEESLALVRPLAESHGIQLAPVPTLPSGSRVRADRTRLRQVLINLLSNGIKYNRQGGALSVHIEVQADTVRLGVQDSGMGLSAEQQARLFTPFERLDADDRQIEGTGIGLALSKRLVDMMGGHIGVDSEPGQGSTFWVQLPRSEDGAVISGAPGDTPGNAPQHPLTAWGSNAHLQHAQAAQRPDCTVLCVEDNELNLQLIDHLLGRQPGIHLLCASEPRQGLRMAHELRPHIILLDINLPEMDGYEVIARLRSDPATATIPVLAVTANAMPGDAARARSAGFASYITKPINVATLLAEVERLRPAAPPAAGL